MLLISIPENGRLCRRQRFIYSEEACETGS